MYDPFVGFKKLEFENGLVAQVLTLPERTAEHIRFVVHSGSAADPDEYLGLAHFTEHMICGGDGTTINQLISYFGAEGGGFSANTNPFRTEYGFSAPAVSKKLPEFFNFWARKFVEGIGYTHLAGQRQIIRSEYLKDFHSIRERRFFERFHSLVFAGTVLSRSHSPLGTGTGIRSINKTAIRSFLEMRYVPSNLTIVAVGGLSTDAVRTLIENSGLLSLPKAQAREVYTRRSITKKLHEHLVAYLTPNKQRRTAGKVKLTTEVVFPGIVSIDQLGLVSDMLTHNLIKLFRDSPQPLAYSVGSGVMEGPEIHVMSMGVEVVPKATRKGRQLFAEAIETLDDHVLFLEMQQREVARKLMLDMTLGRITSATVSDMVKHGRPVSIQEEIDRVHAVSFEDVRHILQYLREPRTVVSMDVYR